MSEGRVNPLYMNDRYSGHDNFGVFTKFQIETLLMHQTNFRDSFFYITLRTHHFTTWGCI